MSALGVELRRQRVLAGLSMSKLAKRSGYTHSHVSRLESGNGATIDCLVRFSRVLGDTPLAQVDSFTVLLYAWIADAGVAFAMPKTITTLGGLIPLLPEGERRDVTKALRELRDYVQAVITEQTRGN